MTRRSEADLIDEACRLRDMDAAEVRNAALTLADRCTSADDLRNLLAIVNPEVRCTTTQPAESRALPRWSK